MRGAVKNGDSESGFFNANENRHIGDQGEYFCRQLYGLAIHSKRNKDRRPDMVSVNGSYFPRLMLEVKTSKDGSTLINPQGLSYGFHNPSDYISTFGGDYPTVETSPKLFNGQGTLFNHGEDVAFYYSFMDRIDDTKNSEFTMPFDDLQIKYCDQIIVPHDLVLSSYIVERAARDKTSYRNALSSVKDIVDRLICQGYNYRDENKFDFMHVYFRDYLAAYTGDTTLLKTDRAKDRFDSLVSIYGDSNMGSLQKSLYIGPNNSHIHVLYHKNHEDLFMNQLKNKVGERRDTVVRLGQQRLRAFEDLGRNYALSGLQTSFDSYTNGHSKTRIISFDEERHMRRLLEWRRVEDDGHEFSDVDASEIDSSVPAIHGEKPF